MEDIYIAYLAVVDITTDVLDKISGDVVTDDCCGCCGL